MNQENNEVRTESVFESSVSTFKRILALVCVGALLLIGVVLIPVFFGGKQAEINEETRASNASYAAAAELSVQTLTAGVSYEEYEGLRLNESLFSDVDVNFKVPFSTEDNLAIFRFEFSDRNGIVANVDKGSLDLFGERSKEIVYPPMEMSSIPTDVILAWVPEGETGCNIALECDGKKYNLKISAAENEEYSVSVSAVK